MNSSSAPPTTCEGQRVVRGGRGGEVEGSQQAGCQPGRVQSPSGLLACTQASHTAASPAVLGGGRPGGAGQGRVGQGRGGAPVLVAWRLTVEVAGEVAASAAGEASSPAASNCCPSAVARIGTLKG